jgi:hypothetical protein
MACLKAPAAVTGSIGAPIIASGFNCIKVSTSESCFAASKFTEASANYIDI